ncbi:MAG: hypothetical protein QNK03_09290 [Myxococcota bacterium]|nr:hypothetical protein [Myxococcota bacterium]
MAQRADHLVAPRGLAPAPAVAFRSMAEQAQGRPRLPWELRLSKLLPIGPAPAAGALVVLGTAVLLAAHVALGHALIDAEPGDPLADGAKVALLVALILSYAVAAFGYLQTTLEADTRAAGVPANEQGSLEQERLGGSRWAGLAGCVVGLVLWTVIVRREGFWPWVSIRSEFWALGLLPLLCWVLARGAYFTTLGTLVRRAETDRSDIDLLDLRPLYLQGRMALRVSSVWIVGISLALPFLVFGDRGLPAVPVLVAALAMGVLSLVLPVRDVQRRVAEAKRTRLAELDAELRRLVQAPGQEPGRLGDLLALRAYIDGLREWPFDTPTLGRFALYMLIPLGSWVCGALVERAVGVLLD